MKLNIVPARTGIQWVTLGIRTFFRQPLALTGLCFLYSTAATLLLLLPVIGPLLALAIVPAATLGLMAATQEAEKGRFPMPTLLVSAFRAGRQRFQGMVVLGVAYVAACSLLILIVDLILGPAPALPATTQEMIQSPHFQNTILLSAALYLPVSLVFWHAPALVHWHGISPVKSLFFSTVACLRNWRAMLLFAVGWVGVTITFMLFGGLVEMVTGNPSVAALVLLPLLLLITPMFFTSLYFTFRDSFVADEPPAPQQITTGETP
jgi:hypothetical protein